MAKGTLRILAKRAGQERLAGAGRPEQQDVRLIDFDVGAFGAQRQPLVVAVNGHGQNLLGVILADDVIVQMGDDFARRGNSREELLAAAAAAAFLVEDRLAKLDAFAANVNIAGPFDQRPDVAIALSAKRTESVLLRRATPASSQINIATRGHANPLSSLETSDVRSGRGRSPDFKTELSLERLEPESFLHCQPSHP